MTRAVIYARASADATGEGLSVARQEAACLGLAAARGWDVVGVLHDNAVTADGRRSRPGWQGVLDLVARGEVDVIVVWHLDRATRSVVELESLITLTETTGATLATATGDVDLTTDVGRMVARILAAVARAEVERKAARRALANEQRARLGLSASGGARPFGYGSDHVTVVEDEAEAIRWGAEQVLAGASTRSIAKAWDDKGLRSSRAVEGRGAWTAHGVRTLLVNPRYAGIRTYRGVAVGPGDWPPVLDQETHLALRAVLEAPRRTMGAVKRGRQASNLLTGIATCAVCGDRVNASSSRGRATYVCRRGAHLSVLREAVDGWVVKQVLARLARPDVFGRLVDASDPAAVGAREEASDARTRLDQLADAFAAGAITAQQLTVATARLRERVASADSLLRRGGVAVLVAPVVDSEVPAATWAALPLEQRRDVVAALFTISLAPVGPGRSATWTPAAGVLVRDLTDLGEAPPG